jgi:error-prone DNA polymerase
MTCSARPTVVGVFQVESRAQMNFLPRMRPRCFYDLVIEVAIVRPGPIQGDMVHPYHPAPQRGGGGELSRPMSLGRFWARRWACRCFRNRRCRSRSSAQASAPEEADRLRRSLATFKRHGNV